MEKMIDGKASQDNLYGFGILYKRSVCVCVWHACITRVFITWDPEGSPINRGNMTLREVNSSASCFVYMKPEIFPFNLIDFLLDWIVSYLP